MNLYTTVAVGDKFEDNLSLVPYKIVNTRIVYNSWKQEVEVSVDMVRIPDGQFLFDVTVNSIFFLNYTKLQF